MSIPAGLLNKKIRLFKRAPVPTTPAGVRAGFEEMEDIGSHWGGFRPRSTTEYRIGGMTLAAVTGVVTLRDNPITRTLSASSRIEVDGQMFEVMGDPLGEIKDGTLRFDVRTAPTQAAYVREMEAKGDVVTLRRVLTGGFNSDVQARATVTGYQPEEIAGGIVYGERRVLVYAADVLKTIWPAPPKVNDKILIQGNARSLNVLTVDDETHRFAGELFAYEIRAAG